MYSDGTDLFFSVSGAQAVKLDSSGLTLTGRLITSNGSLPNPVGMVVDYAGSSAPAGWLLCFGQAISRTTYSGLFAVIGTTYGVGDNSTTFNLPDLRGRVSVGKDDMGGSAANRITVAGGNFDATVLGGTGGAQSLSLTQANLPNVTIGAGTLIVAAGQGSHTHTLSSNVLTINNQGTAGGGALLGNNTGVTATASTLPQMSVSGSTASINGGVTQTVTAVVQPTIILNKIIYTGVN